jgi:transcriptional regulator with XRE-family HTH domain
MNAMSPAELKATRQYLGLSDRDLGEALGVSSRTIRNWEEGSGGYPVPSRVGSEVAAIEAATDQFVAEQIKRLAAEEHPTLATYRSDAEYPGILPHHASWHRAAAARIARAVPGCTLTYAPDPIALPDLDETAWLQLADTLHGTVIDEAVSADPRAFLIGEIEDLEDDLTGETAYPELLAEARTWTRGQATAVLNEYLRKG